jgi:hypothetical protein
MAKVIPNLYGVPKNAPRPARIFNGMPRTPNGPIPFDSYVSQFDLPGVSATQQKQMRNAVTTGLASGAMSPGGKTK